ncbi:macrophage mannose receptor 1-like [Eriocheir sinensis]|uniref:macrophage mannose receptor 1-like n=1 Tax=Eriocheir sinensis TaxID=95602 RepID=UPI0021C656CE|nr:macrophage mannose receptor 1-like [Eriocheir sinensis]
MRQKVDYMWHDEHCYEARQFLCSMAPEKITTTTTVTTKPAPVCEEGWEMFEEAICYKASNAVASWPEARDACLTQGAQLAAITSEGQQNFLAVDPVYYGAAHYLPPETYYKQSSRPVNDQSIL